MQKARRHPGKPGLRLIVGTRFQVLFHSPPGVLFTFPSRYLVHYRSPGVFSLGGWSPQIPTGFHVPRSTWGQHKGLPDFSDTGLLPATAGRSSPVLLNPVRPRGICRCPTYRPATPDTQRRQALTRARFGLTRFRSPLLTGSRLISSPRATKMFQFARCPSRAYVFSTG